ncbi:MAG: chemotaxis-specific protein-glutamate methyltransferase CheB [Planctomycetota bacterium]
MRIAIVNDLRLAVEVLRQSVARIPGATVAWVAEDGQEAVDKCAKDKPDLLLMDMQMPVMDGAVATRHIMKRSPCPIIVVTASIDHNLDRVYDALGAGALDVTLTPTIRPDGTLEGLDALVRKVAHVRALDEHRHIPKPTPFTHDPFAGSEIVAIGCSTGGPPALGKVLAALPRSFDWPVVVVQHIDRGFAPGLAQWLTHVTGRVVDVAHEGGRPQAGHVHLACTDDHLVLRAGQFCHTADPKGLAHRPSVDVFFESLVHATSGIAVLLTGMGRDGADGMCALRRAGWHTIAQDESTSVVWGMPGAAVKCGGAVEVLPLEAISDSIVRAAHGRRSKGRP